MKTFLFSFIIILSITVIPAAAQEAGPDGSFSYTYPIRIPQGVNGIQPDISLVYNSNGGNGMLGMGWSLSGLPVIARDGSYGIDFDTDDHYVFSGQRLIYSDPSHYYAAKGDSGDGYFHTERESFIRIAAYDASHTITGPG
jgi:hypothetical protein